VFFYLLFQSFKERKRISGGPGETRDDAVAQLAHFNHVVFNNFRPHGHLTVGDENGFGIFPNTQDGRRVRGGRFDGTIGLMMMMMMICRCVSVSVSVSVGIVVVVVVVSVTKTWNCCNCVH
jgi:hypothetical protein